MDGKTLPYHGLLRDILDSRSSFHSAPERFEDKKAWVQPLIQRTKAAISFTTTERLNGYLQSGVVGIVAVLKPSHTTRWHSEINNKFGDTWNTRRVGETLVVNATN